MYIFCCDYEKFDESYEKIKNKFPHARFVRTSDCYSLGKLRSRLEIHDILPISQCKTCGHIKENHQLFKNNCKWISEIEKS